MCRMASRAVLLAVGLSLLVGGVASAGYSEVDVLRRRVDELEKRLEEYSRERGLPPARQGVDREQVSQIVREEMEQLYGPETLKAYWSKGLRFKSLDGAFSLKVGGRIMVDVASMSADDEIEATLGELEGDAEFRRARFYMQGSIYENTGYKLQIDFAGGDADFKDAYLEFANLLPIGTVKAGNFKEPFSLEELTSSKYITFMERALPVAAFSPSRNIGVQVANTFNEKRGTWAVGTFVEHNSDDDEATYQEGWNATGRLTYLPYYEDDGARLVHLGAAGSYRNSPEMVRYRARPEVHLASERWVNTDKFMADDVVLCGLEAAWVHGPFSLQGEYITANVDSESMDDPQFDGFYVFASYFLTGEHRPYKTSGGKFDRVKPKNNFDGKGGLGAWEVAARYSNVDLNDGDIMYAGELSNVTLGLNWYLNPNMRIMWNYVNSSLEDRMYEEDLIDDADADTFMMRLQVDF